MFGNNSARLYGSAFCVLGTKVSANAEASEIAEKRGPTMMFARNATAGADDARARRRPRGEGRTEEVVASLEGHAFVDQRLGNLPGVRYSSQPQFMRQTSFTLCPLSPLC
jgi:hypothetical protein